MAGHRFVEIKNRIVCSYKLGLSLKSHISFVIRTLVTEHVEFLLRRILSSLIKAAAITECRATLVHLIYV